MTASRLWVFSDLHQDWPENTWDPAAHAPPGGFDVAVVAGDVHRAVHPRHGEAEHHEVDAGVGLQGGERLQAGGRLAHGVADLGQPGRRHLAHAGVVVDYEQGRRAAGRVGPGAIDGRRRDGPAVLGPSTRARSTLIEVPSPWTVSMRMPPPDCLAKP